MKTNLMDYISVFEQLFGRVLYDGEKYMLNNNDIKNIYIVWGDELKMCVIKDSDKISDCTSYSEAEQILGRELTHEEEDIIGRNIDDKVLVDMGR